MHKTSYLEEFLSYLKYERNMSKNTISSYQIDIKQFLDFTNKEISKIDQKDIREWIFYLRQHKVAGVATANRKLSALKSFFKFLLRQEILDHNPAALVESGKPEKRLPKPIDEKDINKLIENTKSLRDRVVLEILYGTGIRRFELINLKVEDVDFQNHTIRVIGKGNVERIVPIHDEALSLIKQLTNTQKSKWLFPSRKKKGSHISLRQVNEIVTRCAKRAGLKKITPHRFRHSFGSHLLMHGADLKTIQDLLGHANPSTTQIYTKVSATKNCNTYLHCHPRAKKQAH